MRKPSNILQRLSLLLPVFGFLKPMSLILVFISLAVFAGPVDAQPDSRWPFESLGMQQNKRQLQKAPAQQDDAALTDAVIPEQTSMDQSLQAKDYLANLESDVFGAHLFTGAFTQSGATQFNPDYAIAIGDTVQVRFWGAFDYDAVLTVDPKGNIFLPHAGPIQLLGVRNSDLQATVDAAVATVFRSNVFSYASLAAAQPVRVFVSGFVRRPGLYNGTSMDSLLHYLDQAGGIDPARGSFLRVEVKRGGMTHSRINLYDFLLHGRIPQVQFTDGDVIFVAPRLNTVQASGLAKNEKSFEFDEEDFPLPELMKLAKPEARATHVRIARNSGDVRNLDYYPLEESSNVVVRNGDEVVFTADKKPGTITVRVEGEHESAQEYVLPYGTRLGSLVSQIRFSERSDYKNIQLFRISVKERQQLMLDTSLQSLEQAALTARSGTSDESALRKEESGLLLQWVERARRIEPTGRVLIARDEQRESLLLENGDILNIPVKDGLVLVNGEVMFPSAIAYENKLPLEEYIQRSGGYSQNADSSRIVVARRDGSFYQKDKQRWWHMGSAEDYVVNPGDEIMVLPKIDVKSRQVTKDWTQIMFQLALSAGVVLSL